MFWLVKTVVRFVVGYLPVTDGSAASQLLEVYLQWVIWSGLAIVILKLILKGLKKVSFDTIDPKVKIGKKDKPIADLLGGWWFHFCVFLGIFWLIHLAWKKSMGERYEEHKKFKDYEKKQLDSKKMKDKYKANHGEEPLKKKDLIKEEKDEEDEDDKEDDDEDEDEEEKPTSAKKTKKVKAAAAAASAPVVTSRAGTPAPTMTKKADRLTRKYAARSARLQRKYDRKSARLQRKYDR